jgi:hypothetical protein
VASVLISFAALAGGGCTFDRRANLDTPPADTPGEIGNPSGPDAAPDHPDTAPGHPGDDCPNRPELVACYRFERDLSDSTANHNDASLSAGTVTYTDGLQGLALLTNDTTRIRVADNSSLHPGSMTVDGWMKPITLTPEDSLAVIFDDQGQYGLHLTSSGRVRCTINISGFFSPDMTLESAAPVSLTAWTHVACTFGSSTGHLYVNGVEVDQRITNGSPSTSAHAGAAIASGSGDDNPFVGELDTLRLWERALDRADLCQLVPSLGC